MIWVLFVVIVIGAFAIAYWSGMSEGRKQTAAWTEAAARLGLTHVPGTRTGLRERLEGHQRGVDVVVEAGTQSRRNSQEEEYSRPVVKFSLSYPAVAPAFGIVERRFGYGTKSGGIETGNASFDSRFRTTAEVDDEEAVRRYLSPERVAAISRLFSGHEWVQMSHQTLRAETKGRTLDANRLVADINEFVVYATIFADPTLSSERE